jgi:hypothetical protein
MPFASGSLVSATDAIASEMVIRTPKFSLVGRGRNARPLRHGITADNALKHSPRQSDLMATASTKGVSFCPPWLLGPGFSKPWTPSRLFHLLPVMHTSAKSEGFNPREKVKGI